MSGIEAVGLVLGLWPIIESLVKGYKAAKEGDDRGLFLLQIEVQETIYKGCVRQLVQEHGESTIENDDANVEAKQSDPSPWQTPSFRRKLRSRLGPTDFELMESVLKHIERSMISLRNQLENGQAELLLNGTRRSRVKHHLRHIRMNMPHSEFQKSFDRLKEHNKDLQQLVQVFEEPRITPSWNFSAPKDSYHCSCSEGHEADFNVNGDAHFQVYFHVGDQPERSFSEISLESRLPTISKASAINIKSEDDPNRTERNAAPVIVGTPERVELSRSPGQDDYRTSWSRSRHNSTSSGSHERRATRALPMLFYRPLSDSNDNGREIDDMCNLVKSLDKNVKNPRRSCQTVGTLGHGDKHFAARHMESAITGKHVTPLDEKLPEFEEWLLSRQKRVDIAQRLALAIVQFWSTPWIDKWWTWSDFSVKDDDPREVQLFVTRTIFAPNSEGKVTGKPAGIWRYLREPLLIRLGFALIELALGMRLSRLRDVRKYGNANVEDLAEDSQDARDYDTAMTILERKILQEEISVAYQAVVEACLKCEVVRETGAISLTTAANSFSEDVDREILQPLSEYFETNWGDMKSD
ncbi:hypothetical protein CORC01_11619 [Colletotrichum orchidophilum]|uniref:DUF7580 domain-containing protein n=1 Tax=Colletotrichum orchidophilum TaxID=1209926 RepID=A0A1G4AVI3_9PEZI|nr:uncharacterized protein CORC01_11619 [Colletotrichum orchidophilum]OHE93062.1 hypothetical protein CORC01_11619 [Colletotrichum orchidophilum]